MSETTLSDEYFMGALVYQPSARTNLGTGIVGRSETI